MANGTTVELAYARKGYAPPSGGSGKLTLFGQLTEPLDVDYARPPQSKPMVVVAGTVCSFCNPDECDVLAGKRVEEGYLGCSTLRTIKGNKRTMSVHGLYELRNPILLVAKVQVDDSKPTAFERPKNTPCYANRTLRIESTTVEG